MPHLKPRVRSFHIPSSSFRPRHSLPLRRPQLSPLQHVAKRRYQTTSGPETPLAVNVQRPWLTSGRLLYFMFCGTVVYVGTGWFASRLGGADLEALEVEEEEEDHEHEGAIFIPFIWPRMAPRTFYKESDPDWQEFAKVAGDEERLNTIRAEVATHCLSNISKAPNLQQLLGGNVELGNAWLDIKYPDRPPPEYQRYGIEINEDYIAWATQTIPHAHYVQLRHMMYPMSILTAAWKSVSIFAQLQWMKVKSEAGLELNQKDKALSAVCKLERGRMDMQAIQAQSESKKNGSSANTSQIQDQLQSSDPDSHKSKTSSNAQTDSSSSPLSHPLLSMLFSTSSDANRESAASSVRDTAFTYLRPSADMALAWKAFLATLSITWERSRTDQEPKGAFFVVGQVEVRGQRGRIKCDVHSAYDPKTSKIVHCVIKVKHYWEWSQRAKGGP